jgi:hypothetical protein
MPTMYVNNIGLRCSQCQRRPPPITAPHRAAAPARLNTLGRKPRRPRPAGCQLLSRCVALRCAAIESAAAATDWLQRFIDELRVCLHGCGAADLRALRGLAVTARHLKP